MKLHCSCDGKKKATIFFLMEPITQDFKSHKKILAELDFSVA